MLLEKYLVNDHKQYVELYLNQKSVRAKQKRFEQYVAVFPSRLHLVRKL